MATQAQINANRKNAKKSTGPRTAEGKDASSQNAVRHGLFVKKAVVSDESQEEYDRHREAMLAEWEPVGQMETIVAERLINLTWRLQRAQRMQNQAIDYLGLKLLGSCESDSFEDTYRDVHDLPYSDEPPVSRDHLLLGRLAVNDWANYRVLDRMMMYERRIESSMFRTMRELERLQKVRKAEQGGANLCRERSFETNHPHPDKDNQDEAATRRHTGNLVKRSQFAPEFMGTMSYVASCYDEKPPVAVVGNKANRSQLSSIKSDSVRSKCQVSRLSARLDAPLGTI